MFGGRSGSIPSMRPVRSLVLLSLLTCPSLALADSTSSVTVTLTEQGRLLATAAGTTETDLANDIRAEIEDAFQTADVDGFLRAFTDATAFSQRGLAVDYVSVPESFIIGFGGNVSAASADEIDDVDSPTAGAAINLGLMLGANLAGWNLPRWTVFGNAFYNSASTDRLSGHLTSLGAHAQVKLIKPAEDKGFSRAFRWTGLDVTSGVEYTRWSLDAADGLENDFSAGGTLAEYDLRMTSRGEFNLRSNSLTIPVEATTGFRVLGLLSIYGGAGFDLSYGESKVDASLTGDVETDDASETPVGTATITANGNNTGSPAALRALLGLQVNLWKLKLFTQGNLSQTPAASVSFGVRLVL